VVSVGAATRLYNRELTQAARIRIERVSGAGSWQNNGKKGIRLRKEDFIVCCSYSETGITTVLKSVARIRLVKTESLSMCNGEL
jgi:hypothetical protein